MKNIIESCEQPEGHTALRKGLTHFFLECNMECFIEIARLRFEVSM